VAVLIEMPAAARRKIVEDDDPGGRGICEKTVDKVAPDEAGPAYDGDGAARGRNDNSFGGQGTDSHLVAARCRAGWLTRRCQSTAHSPSVWGVIRSSKRGGMITQASATLAV